MATSFQFLKKYIIFLIYFKAGICIENLIGDLFGRLPTEFAPQTSRSKSDNDI